MQLPVPGSMRPGAWSLKKNAKAHAENAHAQKKNCRLPAAVLAF
jgi:hypothetical protein